MSRFQLLAGIEKVFKFGGAAQTVNRNVLKGSVDVKDACNRVSCHFTTLDVNVNGKTLAFAPEYGHSAAAKYIWSHMKGSCGFTALHFAAWDGLIDACKFALEVLKYDVNVTDMRGQTPLTCAAEHGHTAVAKFLVEHGATIESEYGINALHYAAKNGNIEVLKFLLGKGVSADMCNGCHSPLVWASIHGQQEAVKLLLEHGANPNGLPRNVRVIPLQGAISGGSLASLEMLIEAGANVNAADGGEDFMHIAAYHGDPEIIKRLLKAGVNPNYISDLKFSYEPWQDEGKPKKPIEVAAARGNKEAVEILFPLTTRIDDIQEWSVDGIIRHVQSEFGTPN